MYKRYDFRAVKQRIQIQHINIDILTNGMIT